MITAQTLHKAIIARACYVGIFTPGHAYVYADIVIETHGAPYTSVSNPSLLHLWSNQAAMLTSFFAHKQLHHHLFLLSDIVILKQSL